MIFQALPEDQLLGLCIDREARGEWEAGRIAVGSVVLNRVAWGKAHPRWGRLYGDSVPSVILAPKQFSWTIANRLDPNYIGAMEIALDFTAALRNPEFGPWLKECYGLAKGLLAGTIQPNTTALYYHEKSIRPAWARKKRPLIEIGRHVFYA
ncbi:MAG: cell wall hydrolase [Thermodesulfobacteriota bacterium]